MEEYPVSGALTGSREPIRMDHGAGGKYRGFAVFLICCGLLVAAFAVSAVFGQSGAWKDLGGFFPTDTTESGEETTTQEPTEQTTQGSTETESEPETEEMPEGTPVAERDLAYLSLGRDYIHNKTSYRPDVSALLSYDLSQKAPVSEKPLVLILHTHTSEAYLLQGTNFVEGVLGDAVYSREASQNVLAVGAVLAETFEQKGITALHCTVMHDDPTLSGSYDRADKTVEQYLKMYPSIVLVIDLHRDSVMTSQGEFVRSVWRNGEVEMAQVMAVVGSDENGTKHESWEENLALALQLRERLNEGERALCRPVSLRRESYNQELAPLSLLLEIGTAANTVEEAKRSAALVGEALTEILFQLR